MGALSIGHQIGGRGSVFTLPEDLSDRKIALLAQSNKGKTYGLGDILEEMAEHERPFIATDPASNLWGLRVLPDGRPSGLKVIVIGGPHGDLPFEKDQGERMAELLLSTPTCSVIDVAFESANATRKFMTDFAGRLMRSKPDAPPLMVLEECPVLIPQHPFGMQAQLCKSAVAKLAVIGGNFGYGVLPACQRPATMDKDVLSQCDALIVMGMTHTPDRKTVKSWMEAKDISDRAAAAFEELGSLQPGEAWYWSPGEDRFEKFVFRKRRTLHPREMRKLGLTQGAIKLGDMQAFVEKAKRELTKTSVLVEHFPKKRQKDDGFRDLPPKIQTEFGEKLAAENAELREKVRSLGEQLEVEKRTVVDVTLRLNAVREMLKPQYEALEKLFHHTSISGARKSADHGKYKTWIDRAPKDGIRKMIEYLIENTSGTRHQLSTVAGVNPNSTYYNYVQWITRNGIASSDGKTVTLNKL